MYSKYDNWQIFQILIHLCKALILNETFHPQVSFSSFIHFKKKYLCYKTSTKYRANISKREKLNKLQCWFWWIRIFRFFLITHLLLSNNYWSSAFTSTGVIIPLCKANVGKMENNFSIYLDKKGSMICPLFMFLKVPLASFQPMFRIFWKSLVQR